MFKIKKINCYLLSFGDNKSKYYATLLDPVWMKVGEPSQFVFSFIFDSQLSCVIFILFKEMNIYIFGF